MANIPIIDCIRSSSDRPNLDAKYGPYSSVEEAFEALGPGGDDVLAAGLTVGITQQDGSVVEYWFQLSEGSFVLVNKHDKGATPSINGHPLVGDQSSTQLGILDAYSVGFDYPAFSEDAYYTKDDIVFYGGRAYRFSISHHGPWNPSHANPYSASDEIEFLQSSVDQITGGRTGLLGVIVTSSNEQVIDSLLFSSESWSPGGFYVVITLHKDCVVWLSARGAETVRPRMGSVALLSRVSAERYSFDYLAYDYESLLDILATKQNVISDLQTIRQGAAAGALAAPQAQTYTKTEVETLVAAEAERATEAENRNAGDIDIIEEKIPSAASSANKLVDQHSLEVGLFTKQDTIGDLNTIRSNAQQGANAANGLSDLLRMVPSSATEANPLTDRAFVMGLVSGVSANFKGIFDSEASLNEVEAVNSDYAFVRQEPITGDVTYSRYRYFSDTGWEFEYSMVLTSNVIEAYVRENQPALSFGWLKTASGTTIVPSAGKMYILMEAYSDAYVSYSPNTLFRWGTGSYVKLVEGGIGTMTNAEIDNILAN